jgi:hypothetical protein
VDIEDPNRKTPAKKRGRPPSPELELKDLQGFRFFERIKGLFSTLHDCAAHPNRELFFDEYATTVLFYFFNPAITSLNDLQQATDFEKVQKALDIRRMSQGSMSESVRVFDPDLVAKVFQERAAGAVERPCDPRLKDLRPVLTVVDGTLLRALPRMTWAVWLGDRERGVRAHVHFEVVKQTAVRVYLTPGSGPENECLKMHLEPGRLYVLDRGFRDFRLYQEIVQADSSFVARLGDNAVYEVLQENALTPEAQAAGVISDRIVRLGVRQVRKKFDRPVRLVDVTVEEKARQGLGYAVKQVDPKTKSCREPVGKAFTLRVATDRLDLPADVIALIYLHRQKVELFFRFLKAVLGCRHLLSDSMKGISVQVYCALIATLLLAEYTGLAPSKRTFTLVVLYLQGWVQDHEFVREITKLREKVASKKP